MFYEILFHKQIRYVDKLICLFILHLILFEKAYYSNDNNNQ